MMKRVMSVLIAIALLMSVLAVSSVSAGAEEAKTPAVYLLGDAGLDGEVTVTDATLIQRYDASMIELSDKQLLTADVDFNDDVNIIDATWIQRWDLQLKAPDEIGKPLTEVYKTKSLTVLRESLDSTEKADVRVYADQPNVPYMSVTDFYNQFYLLDTDLKEGVTFTRSDNEFTLTNFAGAAAIFDIDDDTILFSNFEYFTMPAYFLQIAMAGEVDNNYPFFKQIETNEPADPAPLTLDLGEYGIDLRGDDSGVYAPVATISDIFATPENFYVVLAGEKLYTKDYSRAHQAAAAMDIDPEFIEAIMADHPADLADFTYRELCFNIDTWYGQPGQEYVHDDLQTAKLDELLTEKYPQIKAYLQSTEFNTFYIGLYHLLNGLLCDGGHTGIVSAVGNVNQALADEAITSLASQPYSERFYFANVKKIMDSQNRVLARDKAYNGDYYIENGDTAMIRFDKFIVDFNGWKAFYAGNGERPLTFETEQGITYDTVGTVLSGLERAKQNPEIKNIIIDMSCNGGGDSAAMMAVEWLINGKGYMHFSSRLTGRVKTTDARFDMNFDGVFDDTDVSPYTDYNYGVLTSNYAFSCGNAFPWFMHEQGAMILGERTTGGACAIRFTTTAGIEFACSSASAKIVTDSGESVDFGCPIDVDLTIESKNPYEDFYDLSTISEQMNHYYGS